MAKNNESVRQANWIAFLEFKDSLNEYEGIANGDIVFMARVVFHARGRTYNEVLKTKLIIQGYPAGIVSIEEFTETIQPEFFHTKFQVDFGKFLYTPFDRTLSIIDRSEKMGGSYKVEISEIS